MVSRNVTKLVGPIPNRYANDILREASVRLLCRCCAVHLFNLMCDEAIINCKGRLILVCDGRLIVVSHSVKG